MTRPHSFLGYSRLEKAQAVSDQLALDLQALKISDVAISIVPGYGVVLVADNATAKGRAENRRVVATLKVT